MAQEAPKGPLRALIIDSGPTRVETQQLLAEAGFQVEAVSRGAEALRLLAERLRAGEPGCDVILKTHDASGSANAVRFLRRLREVEALAAVPVVVTSNEDSRDAVAKCLSNGAADYWVQPLRASEARVLWTRLWRQQEPHKGSPAGDDTGSGSGNSTDAAATLLEETEQPTSKEGSAPNGGRNGGSSGGSGGQDAVAGGPVPMDTTGDGSSREYAKAGSGGGEPANGSHGNARGSGSGTETGAGAGSGNAMWCDVSTQAQPQRTHHHHRHSHHHSRHRHSSLLGPSEAAASEAPAAWQQRQQQQQQQPQLLAKAAAAVPAPPAAGVAAPPAQQKQQQQQQAPPPAAEPAGDAFPSPPPRPRQPAEQQLPAAAGLAAAGSAPAGVLPQHLSQGSGSGLFDGSNTGPNGSNGATTNGNGHGGNGNGNGVTSKQHAEAAPLPAPLPAPRNPKPAGPQPQPPQVVTVGAATAAAAAPATFETRPQEVRKALAAIEAAIAAFEARRKPGTAADAAAVHREEQRQLLLRHLKAEEEEEEAERRGAVEVAEVAEALTSLRDSGSPQHRPLSPTALASAQLGAGAAGMLTRAAAAAAAKGFRPLPPESFTAGSVDTQHLFVHGQHLLLQRQGGQASHFSPPPPAQPAAQAAPAPQPSPPQGGGSLASSPPPSQQPQAQQAPQQAQQAQQQAPMMPPFPGMMPFGPMPPFMGPYGFGWPNPQQLAQQAQQFMQQAPAGLSPAGSLQQPLPSPSQLGQPAQQKEQLPGTPKPDGDSEQAGHSPAEQLQAMVAQQQGQHQAQYAWMLQQYSMAAVAAAAAGQPPPLPPPPPPPLAGGFMGWMARPPMPWQQAMPQGLQFLPLPGAGATQGSASQPGPAAPQAQTPASAAVKLPPLPPMVLDGGAGGDNGTLPPLPLLPLPLPGDVTTTSGAGLPLLPLLPTLSQEALAKKEARRQAYSRYKEKRKNLVFGKKIRYQTRKALADQRPRVGGKFVRMPREEAASTGANTATTVGDTSAEQMMAAADRDAADIAAAAMAVVAAGADPAAALRQDEAAGLSCQAGADEAGPAADFGGPCPMDVEQRKPRRQYAVVLQGESASATQSFSGSGRRRTGPPSHAPRQPAAEPVPAPSLKFGAMGDAGAGASATGPAGFGEQGRGGTPTASAGTAAWQQAHAHLSGHKHRRDTPAVPAAARSDAGKSGGRNGSDSGSNSPCDGGSPVPDSRGDQEEDTPGDQPPPSKLARR